MATKWSNEYATVAEHKDLQASTMALDSTGQYALLAGRRCLAIIDVDNPTSVLKKMPRQSKFEVGSAEWNPHYAHLSAISSNQRTDILSWNLPSDVNTLHSLRSHTRAVSDLNWHRSEPAILATCSADTFINIWDIRDPRKPSISLSAVVGAMQVRWNRINSKLLATSHEGDVRLWDTRKGSIPVQYIAAHLHKIHGLDWSMNQENQLATSSQDCTVKFFDVENPRVVENTLRTICPVWRARYTPFGDGMTTTQLRRGENSLMLWSLTDLSHPVHSFVGHTDVVLEFDWRRSRHDDDYQLVTWSKDQSVRIWRVDANLQKLCGFEPDNEPPIEYGENDPSPKPSGVSTGSSKDDKEIETGLEVVEDTVMSDTSRVLSHKGIAASIAAAQAALSHTLSPSPHRKKKPLNANATCNAEDTVSAESADYSFFNEIQQLRELGGVGGRDSVDVVDLDELQRSFTVNIRTSKHQAVFHVNIPPAYPGSATPHFHIGKGTTVDSNCKSKITKILKQTALTASKKGIPCLESAFQHVLATMDNLISNDKGEGEASKSATLIPAGSSTVTNSSFRLSQTGIGHSSFLPSSALFTSLTHHQDLNISNIPYPRSSGARFCSAGMLICFGRPSYLRRVHNKTTDSSATPRSLSVNQAFASSLGLAPHGLAVSASSTPYGLLYPPVAQSPTGDPSVSISSFYNQDRVRSKTHGEREQMQTRQKSRQTTKIKNRLSSINGSSDVSMEKRGSSEVHRHHKVVGMVTIYDASGLMPLQHELAEHYVFSDTDVAWMCTQNAAVAAQFGRKDLTHVWSLASLLAIPALTSSDEQFHTESLETPWAQNPFGRKLLHAMHAIEHYVKQYDIQTVAMLCCAFGNKNDNQEMSRRKKRSESGSRNTRWAMAAKPGESPYHTIHPGDAILDCWNVVTGMKQNRSNSWSDSLDDFRLGSSMNYATAHNSRPPPVATIFPTTSPSMPRINVPDEDDETKDFRLLDPKFSSLFDNYRRCYADILYRWGLLEARTLVLKYLSTPPEPFRGVDFVTECSQCRQTVRGPQCNLCRKALLTCSICRIVVKGSASFCLTCGHGGHSLHVARWFTEERVCPTGCGCHCLVENMSLLSA